jgi:DNA-binding transcriptional LysR family regulator
MLQLNDEAEAAIQETAGRLRGTLRVACSNAFGRKLLIPSLEQWQQRHPNIHIELLLSDQLAHLIEDPRRRRISTRAFGRIDAHCSPDRNVSSHLGRLAQVHQTSWRDPRPEPAATSSVHRVFRR